MTKEKKSPTRPSADKTRSAILSAAKSLFAKTGFAGTSISQIAKAANVNQSLIYHHFDSKQTLWTSVKKYVVEQFSHTSGLLFEDILSQKCPKAMIENMVHFRFDLYDTFPDLRRIVDWQFLEPNPYELRGIKNETLLAVEEHIQCFQDKGLLIKDYPAEMIMVYIFHAPIGFYKGFKNLQENTSGQALLDKKHLYVNMCIESLVKSFCL